MKFLHKLRRKIVKDNENGARKSVIEELFYDFNRNQFQIYKMNFFRGIFFGLGSVLGGTVVIALLVWLLSVTGALIPGLAGLVEGVTETIQQGE